jgi:hypothetical protein
MEDGNEGNITSWRRQMKKVEKNNDMINGGKEKQYGSK